MKVKITMMAVAALFAATIHGETLGETGLEYSTSGDVVPGVWNTQYDKCVKKALEENIPMLVVWGRKSCSQCKNLDRALAESDTVDWLRRRGYVCLLGIEGEGDSKLVLQLAIKGGSLPFVGFYWGDKNGDGKLDKEDCIWRGCGRSRKMPVRDGTLAEQYMDTADTMRSSANGDRQFQEYVGGGGEGGDAAGAFFANTGLPYDRLEVEDPARPVYVNLRREPNGPAGRSTLALHDADGKLVSSEEVAWEKDETAKEIKVDVSKAFASAPTVKAAADVKAALYLMGDAGETYATNYLYKVAAANTCGNPDFAGCNGFGQWTMDLDAATNLVASAEGEAFTLVSLQGSLWCPDCANTERNFLDDEAFRAWAESNHVALVAIDIPNYDGKHLGLKDESGNPVNDPYMSYETFDQDVRTPCLLSPVGYETRLARPAEWPQSGADKALTEYVLRSGTPYLSRKGVSEAEARQVWERNWNLAWRNTDEGGFHRVTDGNKNRTGVPVFVLLRKDGTVARRFTDFASVSPMMYEKDGETKLDNVGKYLPKLGMMLEIAKTVGDHADETEIENDYPAAADALVALTNGVAVASELSDVDTQDAVRLGFFGGCGTVAFELTGLEPDGLTLDYYLRDAEGKVTKLGSDIKKLTATNAFEGVGECYVMVSHNALTNNAFASYALTARLLELVPGSARTTYTAPTDESAVAVSLVAGQTYRLEGVSESSLTNLFEAVGNGFYTAKAGGIRTIDLTEAGGTLTIQQWQPGAVGFASGETTVLEADCPAEGLDVVVKVTRADGLSGKVSADVVVDREKTNLSDLRYELLTTNIVWNDDGIAEKDVHLLVYPDELFDGFDREVVLSLANITGEDGPTKVSAAAVEHAVIVKNDDVWVVCQNIRVDAAYPIPGAESWQFTLNKKGGSLPSGLKVKIEEGCLVVSGSTSKLGEFSVDYELTAKNAETTLSHLFHVKGVVINPAIEGATPDAEPYNASCADARTWKNLMIVGTNVTPVAEIAGPYARLSGVLNLTIAKAAKKFSAKYTCADGSVSFSSKAGIFADETTHAFYADMPATSAKFANYTLRVAAMPDGSVDISLTDGTLTFSGGVGGAPFSKASPASAWKGYYTVAFKPICLVGGSGAAGAGVGSSGSPYLTLKMESDSQQKSGTVKWAGMLPNGKSVSGSSVLVRGEKIEGETQAYLPAFKKSSTDVFAALMRVMEHAAEYKGEGSVFLPNSFGTDVYTTWTHTEKKSDELSFEGVYSPYGSIYDHAADDLLSCCIDKYGINATNMAFNVAVSSDFRESAKYGPLQRATSGSPVVGPYDVWVDADSIVLMGSGLADESRPTLKFNRKTGIVSGTFLLPFQSKQVKAKYRGVLLLGFGDSCGCSLDADTMPFVNGAWYISDKVADSTGREVSVKRGGGITVDAK